MKLELNYKGHHIEIKAKSFCLALKRLKQRLESLKQ